DREARFADAAQVIRALERCRELMAKGETGTGEEVAIPIESLAATTELPGLKRPITVETASKPRRRGATWTATGAAVLLAVGGLIGWKAGWFGKRATPDDWNARWASPVIAILPVDAQTGGKEEQKLADNLTGELINRVGQLPGTRVIPRSAVMAYRTVPGS